MLAVVISACQVDNQESTVGAVVGDSATVILLYQFQRAVKLFRCGRYYLQDAPRVFLGCENGMPLLH